MARSKVSYTQLTHEVVQQSAEPLTVDEIIARVEAIAPITTKKPAQTIRSALNQSSLIVRVADGRFGWKPRLISGSVLRHTLEADELAREVLIWDADMHDALWPGFRAAEKYRDLSPINLELPDGTLVPLTLGHAEFDMWASNASPAFWKWLNDQEPEEGDYLIVRIVDGDARRFTAEFQSEAAIDQEEQNVIIARNEQVASVILNLLKPLQPPDLSEIITRLLVDGTYKHPIPPDSISDIWGEYVIPVMEDNLRRLLASLPDELRHQLRELLPFDVAPTGSALGEAFFGAIAQSYDMDAPPDLPREYDPAQGVRMARPSALGKQGKVKSYLLRVNHRALPDVWREIEVAEDQTLEDLHLTIQGLLGWSDDHLYSFYMSGQPFDPNTEIGSPWSESSVHTHQVTFGQLGLAEGQQFLYLFDYGDNHEFDVTVRAINAAAAKGKYPKLVRSQGVAPPQYPDIDEETGEMEWDPYAHWR